MSERPKWDEYEYPLPGYYDSEIKAALGRESAEEKTGCWRWLLAAVGVGLVLAAAALELL